MQRTSSPLGEAGFELSEKKKRGKLYRPRDSAPRRGTDRGDLLISPALLPYLPNSHRFSLDLPHSSLFFFFFSSICSPYSSTHAYIIRIPDRPHSPKPIISLTKLLKTSQNSSFSSQLPSLGILLLFSYYPLT